MSTLLNEIRSNFGLNSSVETNDHIVVWDGYDELEKKSAVNFFSRKSWKEIYNHLYVLNGNGGAYYLEEWSVLSFPALSHYGRAYLEFMIETLNSEKPDEEFVIFFIGQLYQVIYMHKGSPFSLVQTEIIKELVQYAVKKSENKECFEYFSNDIKEAGTKFFNELKKSQ